jgi:hypothetical protein
MKISMRNQAGIGHLAAVIVLVVVGIVGFAGYTVYTKNANLQGTNSSAVSPKIPEKISTSADLELTSRALDASSTELDSSLDDSALDADLGEML